MNQLLPVPADVQKKFGDLDMRRIGVHEDGSCWFHAICAALNTDNYHRKTDAERQRIGHDMRRLIIRLCTDEYWDRYWKGKNLPAAVLKRVPAAATVREKLKNTRTWSDVYMILFTCAVLRLNALFTDSKTNSFYCGVSGDCPSLQCDDFKNVFIMWVAHSHFEPIVQHLSDGKCRSLFDHDTAAVRNATATYRQVCSHIREQDVLF